MCQFSDVHVDSFYTYKAPTEFQGFINSKVIYNFENDQWEIIIFIKNETTTLNKTVASLNPSHEKNPLGLKSWNVSKEVCDDNHDSTVTDGLRSLHFHLEVEMPGEFCCHDGQCISSELVCNGFSNCNGDEDEQGIKQSNTVCPKKN